MKKSDDDMFFDGVSTKLVCFVKSGEYDLYAGTSL